MNKVILIGRLTQDPEVRHTTTGKSVCHFRIAVRRRFVRQGEQEDADFFSVTAWEKTGEFCKSYFRKGQQVALIGRLQNRMWTDEQGNRRTMTEIIAEEVYFADSKKEGISAEANLQNENEDKKNGEFYPLEDEDQLPF